MATPHEGRHAWDQTISTVLLGVLLALLALGIIADLNPVFLLPGSGVGL